MLLFTHSSAYRLLFAVLFGADFTLFDFKFTAEFRTVETFDYKFSNVTLFSSLFKFVLVKNVIYLNPILTYESLSFKGI